MTEITITICLNKTPVTDHEWNAAVRYNILKTMLNPKGKIFWWEDKDVDILQPQLDTSSTYTVLIP